MTQLGHHLPLPARTLAALTSDTTLADILLTHPDLPETARTALLPHASSAAIQQLAILWPAQRLPEGTCFTVVLEHVENLDPDEDPLVKLYEIHTRLAQLCHAHPDFCRAIATTHWTAQHPSVAAALAAAHLPRPPAVEWPVWAGDPDPAHELAAALAGVPEADALPVWRLALHLSETLLGSPQDLAAAAVAIHRPACTAAVLGTENTDSCPATI